MCATPELGTCDTTMFDGYGLAAPLSGIAISVSFQRVWSAACAEPAIANIVVIRMSAAVQRSAN